MNEKPHREGKSKSSLHPLSPEEALEGFMQTDPEKVRAAEKREKQIVFFRNVEKSSGGPGSLRAKVRKRSLLR